MLYRCLRSCSDWATQDRLFQLTLRLKGWTAIRSQGSDYQVIDYWVPEDRAYMLYLIDSLLIDRPEENCIYRD